MSIELFGKIESQVKDLEERMKKNGEFVNGAVASIEKLTSDKVAAISDSHVVGGAIQAYKNVMDELKRILGIATSVAPSVEAVVVDAARVVNDIASGNVVGAVTDAVSAVSDVATAVSEGVDASNS